MPEAYDTITPFACRGDKCAHHVQLSLRRANGVIHEAAA
jgi:hypothetical protein